MVHKVASPAFVYTGHGHRETNIRRTGQEYQGLLPGLTSCLDTARWNKLAVRFLRETRKEEIHRLTRVTARGLHLPLQAADKRRRQGTQGQRQVGAGLWTEKVDIVYN